MFAKGMPVVIWGDEQGNAEYRKSLWHYGWIHGRGMIVHHFLLGGCFLKDQDLVEYFCRKIWEKIQRFIESTQMNP